MSNPESITIDTMYSYKNHTNIPWNLKEYRTPQEYLDPEMQVKQRKYQSQKKGIKDNKYVTKRGFYMDYDLKVAKAIPSTRTSSIYCRCPWTAERVGLLKHEEEVSQHQNR